MATKNNPGRFDCYQKAEPDEPMFVLLGRDRHAPMLILLWAAMRESAKEDPAKVKEARECAASVVAWLESHGKTAAGSPNDVALMLDAQEIGLAAKELMMALVKVQAGNPSFKPIFDLVLNKPIEKLFALYDKHRDAINWTPPAINWTSPTNSCRWAGQPDGLP